MAYFTVFFNVFQPVSQGNQIKLGLGQSHAVAWNDDNAFSGIQSFQGKLVKRVLSFSSGFSSVLYLSSNDLSRIPVNPPVG
jgi:hypothetical protein